MTTTHSALFSLATGASLLVAAAASCSANHPNGHGHEGSDREHADSGIVWTSPIDVVTGGAERGPWRMNRSQWNFVDDATVAINAQGFIAVAWADHTKQDILFQMYGPGGGALLSESVNITNSGTIFSWLPRLIITDADEAADVRVFVLWQEIIFSGGSHGGEILFARSDDGGRTFTDAINLSNTTAGAGKGRLSDTSWHNGSYDFVRTRDGRIIAAWTEYEGNLRTSFSANDGQTFSRPLHIAGREGDLPARGPALAAGRDGRVHLAWTVGEDRSANIRYAQSPDGGASFSDPQIVAPGEGHADAPKLAVDSAGTVHLVYGESSTGPNGRYHLRYAKMLKGEQSFEAPREIVSPGAAGADSVHFPMLRIDGHDRLYLAWERFPNRRGRPQGIGFTYSTDLGDTFAAPQLVPTSDDSALGFSGSQQGLLASKLAVNEAGAFAVSNSTYHDGRESRVRVYRGKLLQE